MPSLTMRAEAGAAPEVSPAAELLNAIGLTMDLSKRLALDANGQRFEPAQLDPLQELMQSAALLLRRAPLGGAEPLLRENERQFRERALASLNRALVSAAHAPRVLLQGLIAETQGRNDLLAEDFSQADQAYADTEERLGRWQESIGRRSSSLSGDLLGWLFGGGERLSLPEAAALWNRREQQALDRGAAQAALDLGRWLLDRQLDLRDRLDQLLAEARRLRVVSREQCERLRPASPVYAPWTLRVDAAAIAGALLAASDLAEMLAVLLQRQAEAGDQGALGAHVRELALQEAGRRLAGLDIGELVELEIGATDIEDDALVLVGQALLDGLDRSGWRLAPGARPRRELIQVTPDGAPVYSMDGLSSAAYGDRRERLGFIQVELGVAKDDLLLLREGQEALQAALQQRNLYVLDDLALAWEQAHPAIEPAAEAEIPSATNGRADQAPVI